MALYSYIFHIYFIYIPYIYYIPYTLYISGGDDVQQLCEAGEEEFLEIMALVGSQSQLSLYS